MKRLWIRLIKDNRIQKDTTLIITEGEWISDVWEETKDALQEACNALDIENPVWIASNKSEFRKRLKTTFRQEHFMDPPGFDQMEIEVLED